MSVYNEYNEVICDYECNKCPNVTNCVDRVNISTYQNDLDNTSDTNESE